VFLILVHPCRRHQGVEDEGHSLSSLIAPGDNVLDGDRLLPLADGPHAVHRPLDLGLSRWLRSMLAAMLRDPDDRLDQCRHRQPHVLGGYELGRVVADPAPAADEDHTDIGEVDHRLAIMAGARH
jgi:hypothetical protein